LNVLIFELQLQNRRIRQFRMGRRQTDQPIAIAKQAIVYQVTFNQVVPPFNIVVLG
jgi:hypothetical protein